MATLYVHPVYCQNSYLFPISRVEYRPIQLTETPVINRKPIFISWAFPPEGCIKINTDGSFMPNLGLAGFGGVARDDQGRWLGGFYGRLGMKATSSLTTELWAIHGGLILAKDNDLKKVIIETDSSEALKWLCMTGNVSKSHPRLRCYRKMQESYIRTWDCTNSYFETGK
ncbi:hypothetical protein KY290_007829 [Solanum tuberosum]|uniref:RNase H type-1 domain-containing protein n=1 Tax=Solanum tuberosum TaxID=4113 RepID=A0ABQ7W6S7_SOLTU|nr:hypothetical protein KY290_007829 [Solanum tuberosum]